MKTLSVRLAVLAVLSAASVAWSFEPLPASPPIPTNNPMSEAKVALGRQLYFDKRLSIDGTISCNSCHNVMGSGTDNRPVSVGVAGKKGGRNAPTVWNSAFLSVQFWDGRAATLEDQAKGPIVNPVEMGMASAADAEDRIRAIPGYVSQFEQVFGKTQPVTYDHIAQAIAAYERTLLTPNSPVDRYLKGDQGALSPAAVRGMKIVEKVGCTACHMGPDFAGPEMPAGQGFFQKFPIYAENNPYVAKYHLMDDEGRFGVTHQASDKHLWRVQTWRNVALTAPYFHTGSVPTLDEAVRVMARSQLGLTLKESDVSDIVAFLNGLTGEFPAQSMPRLPQTPNHTLTPQ